MSEIHVRLASLSDSKELVALLNSEENQTSSGEQSEYSNQSIQASLSSKTNRVFIAEENDKIAGVVIVCIVDAGTTLVIKDVRFKDSYNESELVNELMSGVYKYIGSNFRRLKRERFVSSPNNQLGKLFDKQINKLRSNRTTSGKFVKVCHLDRQVFQVDGSDFSFGKKLDKMVRSSKLIHMTRKEADLYILRNLSCLCAQTIIVDSVPHTTKLSNTDTIFTIDEYLIGEKLSDKRDLSSENSLRVMSPSSTSGRHSPSRFQTSHMVSVLDSLHTNLQNMNGSLQGLHDSLLDARPKSLSHGKQLESRQHKLWEFIVYCKDSEIFRAHVLEQLRTALLHFKTNFTLLVSYNSEMTTEAKRLFTEELELQTPGHETEKVEVYERDFEFPLVNGVVKSK